MTIEAMKQALEALEKSVATCFHEYAHEQVMSFPEHFINQTITALRTAIEQAEKQGPVAWVCYGMSSDEKRSIDYEQDDIDALSVGTMLYTHPSAAPRQWVGLTEIEICDIEVDELTSASSETFSFARAIEAKLKEKNNASQ